MKLCFIILVQAIIFSNCQRNTAGSSGPVKTDTASVNRGKIVNEKGFIRRLAPGSELYAIVPLPDTTIRYAPEHLEDSFKKDGLKVIFSGEIQPIPPNVRMWGTPLKLSAIRVAP